jgi:hypothetical protein
MFPEVYVDPVNTTDDALRTGGTRWSIIGHGTLHPPTVVWHSQTSLQSLEWPSGLARWALQHYNTSELHGCTELLGGADAMRCHPGYRGGGNWYDWVMITDPSSTSPVPAKLWTVVKTTANKCEVIATVARDRTGADSVLFTEWQYLHKYEIVMPSQFLSPVFIVKAGLLTVSTMCPQHEWHTHFTSMSETLTTNRKPIFIIFLHIYSCACIRGYVFNNVPPGVPAFLIKLGIIFSTQFCLFRLSFHCGKELELGVVFKDFTMPKMTEC